MLGGAPTNPFCWAGLDYFCCAARPNYPVLLGGAPSLLAPLGGAPPGTSSSLNRCERSVYNVVSVKCKTRMAREVKHLKKALQIRSTRIAYMERQLREREVMVAAREAQAALREAFIERREAALRTREELLRKSETQLREMQWDLEVKADGDSDLWKDVVSGKGVPTDVYTVDLCPQLINLTTYTILCYSTG